MSYGLNLNVSLVVNEDDSAEFGLHMKDTEGLDLSIEKTGDGMEEVAWDVFDELIDQLAKATEDKEETQEEAIARLEKENADLKARMEQLLNDEDVKTTKVASDERHSCGCCDCCDAEEDDKEDPYADLIKAAFGLDFFDLLKSSPSNEKEPKKTPAVDTEKFNKSSAKAAAKNQWKPISFIQLTPVFRDDII